MTIVSDIQHLEPGSMVELYVLDPTALGGTLTYFHAGTNALKQPVVWQGNTFQPYPVQASGFEFSGRGTLPKPKLQVANIGGVITALCKSMQDMIGAKLTRKRTFVKYLDAVNFAGGVNPTADPTQQFPDDIYFINRKTTETKLMVEFELAAAFDVDGVQLPRRQCIQNVCNWLYRSAECGYAGGPVADINDVPTSDPAKDNCSRRVTGCYARFGRYNQLPYGGFPGAGLVSP